MLFNRGSVKHVVGFREFSGFLIFQEKSFLASVCCCVITKFLDHPAAFTLQVGQLVIYRATINLEPKIRTAEKIFIFLPKKTTNALCLHDLCQFIYLPIYLQEPFVSAISYSRISSCNRHGKRFFRLVIT